MSDDLGILPADASELPKAHQNQSALQIIQEIIKNRAKKFNSYIEKHKIPAEKFIESLPIPVLPVLDSEKELAAKTGLKITFLTIEYSKDAPNSTGDEGASLSQKGEFQIYVKNVGALLVPDPGLAVAIESAVAWANSKNEDEKKVNTLFKEEYLGVALAFKSAIGAILQDNKGPESLEIQSIVSTTKYNNDLGYQNAIESAVSATTSTEDAKLASNIKALVQDLNLENGVTNNKLESTSEMEVDGAKRQPSRKEQELANVIESAFTKIKPSSEDENAAVGQKVLVILIEYMKKDVDAQLGKSVGSTVITVICEYSPRDIAVVQLEDMGEKIKKLNEEICKYRTNENGKSRTDAIYRRLTEACVKYSIQLDRVNVIGRRELREKRRQMLIDLDQLSTDLVQAQTSQN